jgi:hypothetical protein
MIGPLRPSRSAASPVSIAEFFTPQIVNAGVDGTTGQFIYTGFSDNSLQTTVDERSLWEARLGIDIKFGK